MPTGSGGSSPAPGFLSPSLTVPGGKGFPSRVGLPFRYVRDLRPLTAIPLDAISASLHTPLQGSPPATGPCHRMRESNTDASDRVIQTPGIAVEEGALRAAR